MYKFNERWDSFNTVTFESGKKNYKFTQQDLYL